MAELPEPQALDLAAPSAPVAEEAISSEEPIAPVPVEALAVAVEVRLPEEPSAGVPVTACPSDDDLGSFFQAPDVPPATTGLVPTPDTKGAAVVAQRPPRHTPIWATRGAATASPAPLVDPEPVRSTIVKVPQPLVRRRGPRRGHVGPQARRPRSRAAARASSRGGDSGDSGLGDEPPGHRPPSREGAA